MLYALLITLFCIHTLYSKLMMVHGSVVGVADESKTTPFSLIWMMNLSLALTGLLSTVSCRERERELEEREEELTVRWDDKRSKVRSNLVFTQ